MKKILLSLICLTALTADLNAQTDGTLTCTFTQVTKTPGYSGTKNVMAVWIQSNTGAYIKTKRRNVGSSTKDHLPTWSVNAGGTAGNATSANCNITDATTGATLSSFATRTITWDGKGVNGAVNGTTVADGVYKVTIQSTWNHGTSGTITKSFTFTKGPNPDHQTPSNDTYFTNVVLDWIPNTLGVQSLVDNQEISIYPNPANEGIVNVSYETANNIRVTNMLGVIIYDEKVDASVSGIKTIDLSNFANGVYFVTILNGEKSTQRKVILNK